MVQLVRFKVDSMQAVLHLPPAKISNIKKEIRKALKVHLISLLTLARLVDRLSASIRAIFLAPHHYWGLQHLKARYLRSQCTYEQEVPLDLKAHSEL